MKEKIKKHFWYYFSFICIELSGLGTVILFPGNKSLEMIIVLMMVFFYVIWSVVHHYIHHSLNLKIFLEYVLIGALGEVIVFSLLI